MTQQINLWTGEFGNLYQDRNKLTQEEIEIRKGFWENIIRNIYMNCGAIPQSVLEIGAGQGPNLAAFRVIYDTMYEEANKLKLQDKKDIPLWATEINENARVQLKENVKDVHILDSISNITNVADMALTYGVLIHTHPAHLKGVMDDIYKASKRWIVCCEYFAPESRMIPYRGENNALWLDDYGSRWVDNYPLRVIGHGFCWRRMTRLDNITFWIFEKTEKMH